MIKLIDYTKKNQEVTHFFIDLDNPNARFAYSSYEDLRDTVKAFESCVNIKCGEIDKIGEEWELTNGWEVKGAETRKRKD
jgi:hypothetical protein